MTKKARTTENKNNVLKIIAVISVFVILFIILFYFLDLFGTVSFGSTQSQESEETCRDVEVPYETTEEFIKTEYYTETVPYTDQECTDKKLIYSITDFVRDYSTCNEKEEVCHQSYPIIGCTDKTVYCVDRRVSCSLTVNNLDDEEGTWDITFKFFVRGSDSTAATDSTSGWLYPRTSETFTGVGRITSKELLDTSYTCSYYVADEPTKQVCRDVIKYKEVQKSREVTAYRPVTKYRTEEKCD